MGSCCAKDSALERPSGRNGKQPLGNRGRAETHISYHAEIEKIKKGFTIKDFKEFKKVKNIEELYRIDKFLGKGTFGEVKRAINIKAGFTCAIKIIDKARLEENQVYFDLMKSELEVL
jgi:serine/threonine protein kinase